MECGRTEARGAASYADTSLANLALQLTLLPEAPGATPISHSALCWAAGSRKAVARRKITGRHSTRAPHRRDRAHLTPGRWHPQRQ
ncbi:hypothetical protein NDU88_002756 [Pleurodeles waltl]|uniref:Uncharacterized protein n=1 Tax=Pleurodeles waltl TaxID=8319 RepID=A0AAV7RGH7_PLEWA|nr:hypothetical protein NDU88_002756 [Pleurodeles waltl]